VRRANEQPARVLDVNLRCVLHLLDWCRGSPPGAIFLSSTSEVADGAAATGLAGYPMPETVPFVLPEPAAPRASYALSKMVAETLLLAQRDRTRVRIGRYHNIYGPRMGHDHVIPQFIARAMRRPDPFPIYGAKQTRAFCHIDDAVRATVALLRLPGADPVLANVGNDREEIRIDELAAKVVRLVGYRPTVAEHDPPPGSPQRRLPDLRTLRTAIGYEPEVGLDAGLAGTFAWYAAQ
jgi:UDP-glucose 4-epimerase/UDP-glucuronate decarboxylase